jgi:hypothetical protein
MKIGESQFHEIKNLKNPIKISMGIQKTSMNSPKKIEKIQPLNPLNILPPNLPAPIPPKHIPLCPPFCIILSF